MLPIEGTTRQPIQRPGASQFYRQAQRAQSLATLSEAPFTTVERSVIVAIVGALEGYSGPMVLRLQDVADAAGVSKHRTKAAIKRHLARPEHERLFTRSERFGSHIFNEGACPCGCGTLGEVTLFGHVYALAI